MARKTIAGIDIGTHQVKVVVAESRGGDRQFPAILGTGMAQSRGLRHGYIINSADVVRSIQEAVVAAEKASDMKIKRAYMSVGGVGLEEIRTRGEVATTRVDSEITDFDIEKVLSETERRVAKRLVNRKILHVIPLRYRIDGEEVLGRPQGMKGTKLEVEVLFVTCLEQHLNDLIQATEEAGVEVIDAMASPLAGSFVTLTKAQKIAGCVLANIGAETVSIVVFENNIPQSVRVFPSGSTDITNDIALGLKVSLEEAEQLKLGAVVGGNVPRKKLDDIVAARLSDIFELIEAHLKTLGKSGLLPAGIILTGGGTGIATIEDIARVSLKLPSKIGRVHTGKQKTPIRDSSWAVAYGLTIWGFAGGDDEGSFQMAKQTTNRLVGWFKQFLP